MAESDRQQEQIAAFKAQLEAVQSNLPPPERVMNLQREIVDFNAQLRGANDESSRLREELAGIPVPLRSANTRLQQQVEEAQADTLRAIQQLSERDEQVQMLEFQHQQQLSMIRQNRNTLEARALHAERQVIRLQQELALGPEVPRNQPYYREQDSDLQQAIDHMRRTFQHISETVQIHEWGVYRIGIRHLPAAVRQNPLNAVIAILHYLDICVEQKHVVVKKCEPLLNRPETVHVLVRLPEMMSKAEIMAKWPPIGSEQMTTP